jgi:hypothetical protein
MSFVYGCLGCVCTSHVSLRGCLEKLAYKESKCVRGDKSYRVAFVSRLHERDRFLTARGSLLRQAFEVLEEHKGLNMGSTCACLHIDMSQTIQVPQCGNADKYPGSRVHDDCKGTNARGPGHSKTCSHAFYTTLRGCA